MEDPPEERVCLKCFNRWTLQKAGKNKPQCTNLECRSRTTVPLSVLEENVVSVKRAMASLPAPVGEFLTPPALRQNFPTLLRSSKDVVDHADARAADGVDIFRSVLLLASEWDPETEPLTDTVDRLATESDTEQMDATSNPNDFDREQLIDALETEFPHSGDDAEAVAEKLQQVIDDSAGSGLAGDLTDPDYVVTMLRQKPPEGDLISRWNWWINALFPRGGGESYSINR